MLVGENGIITKAKEAQLTLSGAGTVNSNPTVRIKVTHTDDQSGIEIQKSKWVYNISANAIGLNEASYTGGNFSIMDKNYLYQ